MIIEIEDSEQFSKVLEEAGDKLVVVDFSAVWCGPCKNIAPVFKKLSENEEYANVIFLKVDVDDVHDVAQCCEIKCMPTFQFYRHAKKIQIFEGANEEKLKKHLNELK